MKILTRILNESEGALELIFDKHFHKRQIKLEIEDAVLLGFFEDMVRKADIVKLLIEEEKGTSIDIISRSLLESYVYFKLLLKKDRRLYAQSFWLARNIKGMEMMKKVLEKNRNGQKLRELLGRQLEDIERDMNIIKAIKKVSDLKNKYSNILNRRNEKQAWYNLDGKTRNFEQLCRKMNLYAEYELVYRILSNEVHSTNILDRWCFESNEVQVYTDNKDIRLNKSLIKMFLLEGVRELYEFYGLKKELNKFNIMLSINYKLSK